MTNAQRLAILLTLVNLVLLIILLTNDNTAHAQGEAPVLRGRGLELVDDAGQVRAQFNIESNGEAVFRIRDADGTIRVKLGADKNGSGLVLMDEKTEPGIQMIARGNGDSVRSTTSINLIGSDGKRKVITP